MPRRRTFLAALGGVALAGCTAATPAAESTGEAAPNDAPTVHIPDDLTPEETVVWYYQALFSENLTALNERLVHPESPTYPLGAEHVPPGAFDAYDDITLASVEAVSVQDRVVQRLYHNTSHSSRTRRAMGADRLQYVHTTFHVSRPEEEAWYAVDIVDYLVSEDDTWYLRFTDRLGNTEKSDGEPAETEDGEPLEGEEVEPAETAEGETGNSLE